MAVRASMADIINLLEDMINDTGNAIWSTQNLQDLLDRDKTHIQRELLSNDVEEKRYWSRYGMLEGDASTWDNDDTIIKMWDSASSGASAVTPDDYNLIDGSFAFDDDQNNTYYLDAISYDLNEAAAKCMDQLSMDLSRSPKWARGSVSYNGPDPAERAKYFRSLGGPKALTLKRVYPYNPSDPKRRTIATR